MLGLPVLPWKSSEESGSDIFEKLRNSGRHPLLRQEPLFPRPLSEPPPRSPGVERWFFAGDAAAAVLAFLLGGAVTWLIDRYIFGADLKNIFSQTTVAELILFLGMGAVAFLWLDSKGHYRHRLPYWETVGHILLIMAVGFTVGGFVQFATRTSHSRLWLGLSWLFFGLFLYMGRSLVRRYLAKRGKWQLRALVVGDSTTAMEAISALAAESYMGYKVVGLVPADELGGLNRPHAWRHLMRAQEAQHVFLALEGGEIETYQPALKWLACEGLPYSIFPPWLALPSTTLSSHSFFTRDVMLMHSTNRLHLFLPRMIKRSFDVLLASLALAALALPMLVIALLVKRDGGPAFYGQPRIGLHGRKFRCLKFRSMAVNSDELLDRYLKTNPAAREEWRETWKLKDDPRITKIGAFLRKTSLDELPQLINVIRGDMSLVGPRPIVTAETEKYDEDIRLYYMVRPGITGLWQVSGRNDVSYGQRVSMDSWYVRNWSLLHDIAIICKTFPVLMKRTGAY